MEQQQLIKLYEKNQQNSEALGRYKHLMYCPFTGLGLYDGFRGNKWLKNRIKIFKQFVIPSLQAQTSKNFTLWISWRPEEKYNKHVKELQEYLKTTGLDVIHTFTGVCFYDDKYEDKIARERLTTAIHGAMIELVNATEGDFGYEWVLMTIQPSDDCYANNTVAGIQNTFLNNPKIQALGFSRGYIMNYQTKELAEWNPKTNPPFYTIKFPRPTFIDPLKHVEYTALKHDVGIYKQGTPLPSHEYVKDCFVYGVSDERQFLVGTHGVNISTVFNHPYKGADKTMIGEILWHNFGLYDVEPLKLSFSARRALITRLPYKVQRKLRYLAGEKKWLLRPIFSLIYNGLR